MAPVGRPLAGGREIYDGPIPHQSYPRIQILTIRKLLEGKKLKYLQGSEFTFKKAVRKKKEGGLKQENLFQTGNTGN